MKKVMVLLAAAALAATSQAASFKWTANAIAPANSGDALNKYTAYLIDASKVSYATAQTNIGKGDVSFISGAAILDSTATAAQGTTGNALINRTGGTTTDGTAYTAYFVILDDATSPTKALLSTTTKDGTGQAMTNTTFSFGGQSGASWTTLAVPEPTSGLLMLVGLGALALRRRRA